MARETIFVPVSREPLFEAVAVFLAVLAYPDDGDRRARFAMAWQREHLRVRAEKDEAFAAQPQPIRPALFLMTDEAIATAMRKGAKALAERKEAVIATHSLFEAKETGRASETLRAFGAELKNDAEGRALMTRCWQDGGNWGASENLNIKNLSGNLTTRVLNPSRPVLHAAMAYWRVVRGRASCGV